MGGGRKVLKISPCNRPLMTIPEKRL